MVQRLGGCVYHDQKGGGETGPIKKRGRVVFPCLHHVVEDGDFDHKKAREREDAPHIGVAREEMEAYIWRVEDVMRGWVA